MSRRRHSGLVTYLKTHRSLIISIAVLVLLALVLSRQIGTLQRSLDSLRQASPLLVSVALVLTALTYALSAEIYHLLLKHPIRLRTVFMVQLATALTARIVPVGVGTMGFNAIFLHRQKHTTAESLAVVTVNNGLGLTGHLLLLAAVSFTAPLPSRLSPHLSWDILYWALLVIALLIVIFTWSNNLWRGVHRTTHGLIDALVSYRLRRRQLGLALITSISLTLVYSLVLLASSQALGVTLPFNQVFLIYTLSLVTGSLTPTPGGLVGVEAGLVAGLVAYGVPGDSALAIALLYRLITYWLPLLPGLIAFRAVQKHYF